jgi:hypothetical protein
MSTRRSFIAAMIGGVAFARHIPDLKSPLPTAAVAPALPVPVTEALFVPQPGDMFLLGPKDYRSAWLRSVEVVNDFVDVTCIPSAPVHSEECARTLAEAAHYQRMKAEGKVELIPYDADFDDDCYEDYPALSEESMSNIICNCAPLVSTGCFRQFIPSLQDIIVKGRIGYFDFVAKDIDFSDKQRTDGVRKFVVTQVTATVGVGKASTSFYEGYKKV